MKSYQILSDCIKIEFEKALYWDKIFLRDKYINHAIKYKIPIKVKMDQLGGKVYVITDVKKWKKDGEKMSKVFKIANRPMKLFGNFLENYSVEENLQGVIDGAISITSAFTKMAEADPVKWEKLRKLLHKK